MLLDILYFSPQLLESTITILKNQRLLLKRSRSSLFSVSTSCTFLSPGPTARSLHGALCFLPTQKGWVRPWCRLIKSKSNQRCSWFNQNRKTVKMKLCEASRLYPGNITAFLGNSWNLCQLLPLSAEVDITRIVTWVIQRCYWSLFEENLLRKKRINNFYY